MCGRGIVWVFATAIATVALGALAEPRGAAAQTPRLSALFNLSDCGGCTERTPLVAADGAGNFLTIWDGTAAGVAAGVFARPFDPAATPLGAEFQMQQPGPSVQPPQFDGAVSADAQGNFVVVWSSSRDDISSIVARRFDPAGKPLGAVVEVASDPAGSPTTPSDFRPAVTGSPDGGFAVAWISLASPDSAAGTPPRVMLRRFDAADAPTGPALQISTGLVQGDRPSLCASATGRVMAAWTFADAFRPFEANLLGVAVARVTPNGVLLDGGELEVAPALASDSWVAVSCGGGNTFVVAWHTDQAPAASGLDVVAQRFTRRGRRAGDTFVVNQLVEGDQKNPSIFHDAAGTFTIVWEARLGAAPGIRGRRFAADATPLTDEFRVIRAPQGYQLALRPVAAPTGADSFVVVWGGANGLFGRELSFPASAGAAAAAAAAAREGAPSTGNGHGVAGLW